MYHSKQRQPMSETAKNLLAALNVAAEIMNAIPAMVTEFDALPNSRRNATLDRDELVKLYGSKAYSTMDRLWLAHHGAITLSRAQRYLLVRAVRLPEQLYVGQVFNTLDYRYFHGNRVWGGKFIATQTPVVRGSNRDGIDVEYDTRADFWIAAYYHNVRAVVMLNRVGENDSAIKYYFPTTIGESLTFYAYKGGIPVSIMEINAGRPGAWRARTTVRCEALSDLPAVGLQVRELSVTISVRDSRDSDRTHDSVRSAPFATTITESGQTAE